MFKYLIFLYLGVSFCAYAHEERFDGRIIGGHTTVISKHPYQVSVQVNGKHDCGGSIIGNRIILTAAHCVKDLKPKNLKVRVGSSVHNFRGQLIAVETFLAHDKEDTALLRLKKKIKFDRNAKSIKLNKNKNIFGQPATVSGWGCTEENGKCSKQLQAVGVNILSQSDCIKAYGSKIGDTEFCAGVIGGGKDSCQGDSGGPLVVKGVLVGIVSCGKGCGRKKYPGVYVNVAKLGTWIENAKVKLSKQ